MNKVRILALLLAAYCVSVHAQPLQLEYRTFAQEGKTWESQVGLIMENVYGNSIDGDTIIGGEIWKKVYNYIGSPEFNYYYAAIHDVGKKVYAIAKGSNKPRLLYDFGLKVGNTVKCGVEGNAFCCLLDAGEQPDSLFGFEFIAYLRVERIDTIEVRNSTFRQFKLTMLDSYKEPFRAEEGGGIFGNIVWIEGIGSGAGPFSPWMPLPPKNSVLISCEIDKTCIFGFPDFYELEGTNAAGSPNCIGNDSGVIYNLQGLRMGQPLRGVYIQRGKKHIAK